jgi:hypothetical protein
MSNFPLRISVSFRSPYVHVRLFRSLLVLGQLRTPSKLICASCFAGSTRPGSLPLFTSDLAAPSGELNFLSNQGQPMQLVVTPRRSLCLIRSVKSGCLSNCLASNGGTDYPAEYSASSHGFILTDKTFEGTECAIACPGPGRRPL